MDAFDANCHKVIAEVVETNRREGRNDRGAKKKIRIATKSIRCVFLLKRFISLIEEADPEIFAGLLCFSAKEMLQLVQNEIKTSESVPSTSSSSSNFKHMLLAYPVMDSESIQNLIEAKRLIVDRHRQDSSFVPIEIAVVVDSIEQVSELLSGGGNGDGDGVKAAADNQKKQQQTEIKLWIDLDMSWKPGFGVHFGVRRSPIDSAEKVKGLVDMISLLDLKSSSISSESTSSPSSSKDNDDFEARQIASAQPVRLTLEGVQAYEAQIAGFADVVLRSPLPYCIRRLLKNLCSSSSNITSRRTDVMNMLINQNKANTHSSSSAASSSTSTNAKSTALTSFECNGGGSGSIRFSLSDPAVTEITVGSCALCGHQFDGYVDEPLFSPAVFFTLIATRQPTKNIFTCHGGGFIASGDPGWCRLPKIVWPVGGEYFDFEGAGEVQTPISVQNDSNISVGDMFVFRPNKSGELGEVFSEYVLVMRRGDETQRQVVKTYRGDGINCWS